MGAAGGSAATAVPHWPQNRWSAARLAPHDGQASHRRVPHEPQNRLSAGVAVPHEGQVIGREGSGSLVESGGPLLPSVVAPAGGCSRASHPVTSFVLERRSATLARTPRKWQGARNPS